MQTHSRQTSSPAPATVASTHMRQQAPQHPVTPAHPADEAGRGANQFSAEEIALVSWIGDPEAQALLKRIAVRPPAFETMRRIYARTRDEWTSPTGARVERLRAIRERIGTEILKRCDKSGDYALMKAFCATPNVDQAVAGAIAAGRFMRRGL